MMAECEFLPTCCFYNEPVEESAALSEVLKHKYCFGSNDACARLVVRSKLGPTGVPRELWPNDLVSAGKLIRGAPRY